MLDFFERKMKSEGVIRASTKWFPACSFLEDTCDGIMKLATVFPPGIYMLDSNERWNIYEIAMALNEKFNFGWKIEPSHDYVFDSRMSDERMKMISLKERSPQLNLKS